MAMSLGICDFLHHFTGGVSIKWPNDIYINSDKIAGILIEASIINNEMKNVIVGIGLNLNQEVFKSDAPNPVSLKMVTGDSYEIVDCLKRLASLLDIRYKQILQDKRTEINRDYLAALYRFGKWSNYRDANGSFEGRIISVTSNGSLLIGNRKGSIHEYGNREVDFI